MGGAVDRVAVGCPHPAGKYPAPVHYVVVGGRFRTWPCHDRNCADAIYARDTGQVAYHAEDQRTGRIITYFRAKPEARQEQE